MKVLFCFYRLNNNLSEVHALQLVGTFLMPHSVSGVYLILSSAIISVMKQGYTTCSHPWTPACVSVTPPSMLFCPQHCLSTATRDWIGLRFYFVGRVKAGLFLNSDVSFQHVTYSVTICLWSHWSPVAAIYLWAWQHPLTHQGYHSKCSS